MKTVSIEAVVKLLDELANNGFKPNGDGVFDSIDGNQRFSADEYKQLRDVVSLLDEHRSPSEFDIDNA